MNDKIPQDCLIYRNLCKLRLLAGQLALLAGIALGLSTLLTWSSAFELWRAGGTENYQNQTTDYAESALKVDGKLQLI